MPLLSALAVLTQKCRYQGDPGKSSKKSPAKKHRRDAGQLVERPPKKHPETTKFTKKMGPDSCPECGPATRPAESAFALNRLVKPIFWAGFPGPKSGRKSRPIFLQKNLESHGKNGPDLAAAIVAPLC
jgi:hypothetical protein